MSSFSSSSSSLPAREAHFGGVGLSYAGGFAGGGSSAPRRSGERGPARHAGRMSSALHANQPPPSAAHPPSQAAFLRAQRTASL
jgi:hypothetical protein